MQSVKVTIKPKGLIAFSVLTAGLSVLVASAVMSRKQAAGGAPAPAAGAQTPAAPDIYENDDERQDATLLRQLDAIPGQKRDWLFLGPLPSGGTLLDGQSGQDAERQMSQMLDTPFLPNEAKYQAREGATLTIAGRPYAWRKVTGSGFEFKRMFVSAERPASTLRNAVVYGVAYLDSPAAAKKLLHFRSDDGAVVWVNGAQVYRSAKIRGCRDEDVLPIALRKGRNTVLVKVGQWGGGWGMAAQFEDPIVPATGKTAKPAAAGGIVSARAGTPATTR